MALVWRKKLKPQGRFLGRLHYEIYERYQEQLRIDK